MNRKSCGQLETTTKIMQLSRNTGNHVASRNWKSYSRLKKTLELFTNRIIYSHLETQEIMRSSRNRKSYSPRNTGNHEEIKANRSTWHKTDSLVKDCVLCITKKWQMEDIWPGSLNLLPGVLLQLLYHLLWSLRIRSLLPYNLTDQLIKPTSSLGLRQSFFTEWFNMSRNDFGIFQINLSLH